MEIYYLSSRMEKLDLMSERIWIEQPEKLLNMDIKYELSSNYSGYAKVKDIYEEPSEKSITLKISADDEDEFNDLIEQIERTMVADGLMGKAGKVYWGDAYKEILFIKRDNTEYTDFAQYLTMTVTFLFMDHTWTKEESFSYRPIAGANGLKLAFKLPQTLPVVRAVNSMNLDHYMASDFVMTAYGPFTEFSVVIGDHTYSVNYTASEGDQLIIDSRATTEMARRCYCKKANGTEVNLFNQRGASGVFEKIPGTATTLEYSQTFGLDLTVFVKGSDPRWI